MSVVVDASAIVSLALEGEDAALAERVLVLLEGGSGYAPPLFWYEVASVLLVNEPKGRISPERSAEFLQDLLTLPIDDRQPIKIDAVHQLARRRGLTPYDAAYLELAVRTGSPLATHDRELRTAAEAEGVSLIDGHDGQSAT